MSHRFEELWTQYLEGELDEKGLARLEEMLADDDELLQRAGDLYEEHRLLGFALQPFDDRQFVNVTVASVESDGQQFVGDVITELRQSPGTGFPKSSMQAWYRWGAYALVAAATLLLSLAIQSFSRHTDSGSTTESVVERVRYQPVEYVATLVRCQDCVWESSSISEGSRLVASKLTLASGSAVIQFDGGALALLTGPVQLRLESAAGARLLSGNVMVRAPEEAAGFVLRTPASDIVDLGTEFAVSVEDSGATEVHVTEGEVQWHKPNQSQQQVPFLAEGEAIRFDSARHHPRTIPLAPRRFSDVVPPQSRNDGRLLAYEPFDYASEVSGTEEQAADGGFGWQTPWYCGFPESSFDLFFDPNSSLESSDALARPVGGSLRLPTADHERRHRQASKRQFSNVIDLAQDGVVYFSFLVRRDSQATLEGKGSFHWILCKPRDLKARLGVGVLSDGRPIVYGPSGNAAGSSPLQNDVPYCFVGKLVHGKDHPEQLFLKVFGPDNKLDRAEPLDWTVVGRTVQKNQKLSQVHVYNAPGRSYAVDEIRIGTSWEAVTIGRAQ